MPNFTVLIEENTCCFQRTLKPRPHILNNMEDLIFNIEDFSPFLNIFASNIEILWHFLLVNWSFYDVMRLFKKKKLYVHLGIDVISFKSLKNNPLTVFLWGSCKNTCKYLQHSLLLGLGHPRRVKGEDLLINYTYYPVQHDIICWDGCVPSGTAPRVTVPFMPGLPRKEMAAQDRINVLLDHWAHWFLFSWICRSNWNNLKGMMWYPGTVRHVKICRKSVSFYFLVLPVEK